MDGPRTLVVSGASRGIGRHVAMRAQAAGWRVIGLARQTDAGAPFEMRACDVADSAAVRETFRALRGEPRLHGLVNAAGIASMNLLLATPPETMRRLVEVNLLGTMYCCAEMGRLLARRRGGRIVNFSTIAVALGLRGEAAYVAAKSGVEGFSRAFAREMADFAVTVNTIAPGPVETDLIRHVPKGQIDAIVARQVVPRMAEAEDVWQLVAFLLGDAAAMMSGQVLHVGGA
ncbi:MAG: SDR family oxidoreductase [Alphaproteobacteria bacterium]|nr:SDR family oxidoreductase [Alphaproteobacteria bacterium]